MAVSGSIRVGNQVINLDNVNNVSWDGSGTKSATITFYFHASAGRVHLTKPGGLTIPPPPGPSTVSTKLTFTGDEAQALINYLEANLTDALVYLQP